MSTDAEFAAGTSASKVPSVKQVQDALTGGGLFTGEIYHLYVIRPGFVYANGQTLSNADAGYPALWAWLQDSSSAGGAALCVTASAWTSAWNAIAANDLLSQGICGFYVQDTSAKTIKVPDLRGAYMEAAGYDGMSVGGVHGDMIRNIKSAITETTALPISSRHKIVPTLPPFYSANGTQNYAIQITAQGDSCVERCGFDASLVVPTGNANKPRAIALYPCIYAG
jgi:hypothetical protein